MKHNKKRNTAFLYESLVKELTKSIVRKEHKRKDTIVSILKEYFSKGQILHTDLQLYKSILENEHKMTDEFSKRFLIETKKDFYGLDRKSIFNKQTELISQINRELDSNVYANFISNYKNIATVGQWFNSSTLNAKSRILIETKVQQILVPKKTESEKMQHIDNLTYKTFTEKFNDTYKRTLRENQKTLLTCYITSFSDNGLELKGFMNEEIGRLKAKLEEIKDDKYKQNIDRVVAKLEKFKERPIDESMVKDLFYIQDLIGEIHHGN